MKNILVFDRSTTFEKAVKLLDENGNGFLPIVDTDRKLIGVITDGDLRRGILNNIREVEGIMNKKPITMPSDTPHVIVRKELKRLHRRQMPLVKPDGTLEDVVILNDFEVKPKDNWVVIMAGGLGSRLGELTKETPKPMLPVAGRPMLEQIIDNFKEYGFFKFVLCVNYKANIIQEHFGNGEKHGVEIKYTLEKARMGTAGALSLIEFDLSDDFFVVNGDLITSLNFDDFMIFHQTRNADATMCVKQYSHEVPFACVDSDISNNLLKLVEKPNYEYHINAGMYILNKTMLSYIPKNTFFDMPSLFERAVEEGRTVKVFRMEDYWLDIGKPDDYKKGNDDLQY